MKPVNHYMRLIFTADGQTTYGEPTCNNSNLPDLFGYTWARIIVEKAVVNARDPSGNTDAVSYLTINLGNNPAINQSLARTIGSNSSTLIDAFDGEWVQYGESRVMKYTNERKHVHDNGMIVPVTAIQNNNMTLELKLSDGTTITQPTDAHLRDYIIILGIELIK